jgi:hypothetical protein
MNSEQGPARRCDYAILMLDPEGWIAGWNTGAERLKGWRATSPWRPPGGELLGGS